MACSEKETSVNCLSERVDDSDKQEEKPGGGQPGKGKQAPSEHGNPETDMQEVFNQDRKACKQNQETSDNKDAAAPDIFQQAEKTGGKKTADRDHGESKGKIPASAAVDTDI